MSPVFCNPRSLDMLMAAQRFHKGNSQTDVTELDSSAEESLALDFALCMVQVYLVAHVFECHGGSCFFQHGMVDHVFSTCHGGSWFFNMSWWFMVFQHVMVVHVFPCRWFMWCACYGGSSFLTCHGGSCLLHQIFQVHVFYISWWFMLFFMSWWFMLFDRSCWFMFSTCHMGGAWS